LSELAFQNHTLDTATKNLIFGTEFFLRLRSDDDRGVMVMMMSMVSSGECWHRRAQQQNTGQYGKHCCFQINPPANALRSVQLWRIQYPNTPCRYAEQSGTVAASYRNKHSRAGELRSIFGPTHPV